MILRSIFLLAILLCFLSLTAYSASENSPAGSYYFERNPGIEGAFEHIAALRLESAKEQLDALAFREPGNMLVPFYRNYVDVLHILITEDEEAMQRLEKDKSARLSQIDQADRNSPYFLLTEAEIHLHCALARLRFEEYFTAATEVNKAFRLLKRNIRLFPDFPYSYRTLGMLKAAVGTLPDKYQWIISLLTSMEGSVDDGLDEMAFAFQQGKKLDDPILRKESGMLYALALINFANDGEAAWEVARELNLLPGKSTLDCFFLSYLAMHSGKNDLAISYLEKKPHGKEYADFHFLNFMYGEAKLYRNDPDASQYLLQYVHEFPGRHYIKEAYQKLGWHALIHKGETAYRQYMRLVEIKGVAITDEDKHALKEAKSGNLPVPCLLKARVSFDGHYFERARKALLSCEETHFSGEEMLEFTYRSGRIAAAQEKNTEALRQFDKTITLGSKSTGYYACSAALHAAIIFEEQGNTLKAKQYFNTCLSFRPDDYQNSLHQKAKAGLSRLSGK